MPETEQNDTPSEYLLTTFDNPFDPFDQWDQWYSWDLHAGYNTLGLLARISHSSTELSEVDQYNALQNAIDEIVRENVSGMHRKVQRGELAGLVATNKAETNVG